MEFITCKAYVTTVKQLILLLILLQLSQVAQLTAARPVVPAVIAFGDSIVDPGNNNVIPTVVKSNFPPYGRDFIGHVATGRFSDGKISTDFISSMLGVKELLPAYLGTVLEPKDLVTGVSFASAGTGYDPITAITASVIPMQKQLELFKDYKNKLIGIIGEERTAQLLSDSFFIVCAGSNDVIQYSINPIRQLGTDMSSYAQYLVQLSSSFIQELISLGARKIGVFTIPPTGCTPSQRTLGGGIFRDCADNQNQLAQAFNWRLKSELESINENYRGTRSFSFDIYATILDLVLFPKKYGFQESRVGCCGTGIIEAAVLCNSFSITCSNASEYVFWDSIHPTQRAYEVLAGLIIPKYIHLLH